MYSRMHIDWLIIDGYSMLHRHDEALNYFPDDLFLARRKLLQLVSQSAAHNARRITVVFDGAREGGVSDEGLTEGIEVHFAPARLSADAVIERWVHRAKHPETILVVTSDRLERDIVSSCGAQTQSSSEFVDHCRATLTDRRQRLRRRPTPTNTLGDYFK